MWGTADRGTHVKSSSESARRRLSWWQEGVLLLVVAVVLAVVIKALLVQAFYIPSESMEPGLVKEDRILVQKVSYWGGGSPQRGDVVVFEDPGGWLDEADAAGSTNALTRALTRIGLYPAGGHLVKRVIGVAGDTIVCCDEEGRLSVNGETLDEDDYIAPQRRCNGPMTGTCDWTAGPVPEGRVFVMGDNRNDSRDSTVHMLQFSPSTYVAGAEFVDTDLVVGRVFALIWPRDHATLLHRPPTFEGVPDAP
ncbi:MAG: lepB [Nocardioides sp.]|nr:lepB [Nocardioides sp.]